MASREQRRKKRTCSSLSSLCFCSTGPRDYWKILSKFRALLCCSTSQSSLEPPAQAHLQVCFTSFLCVSLSSQRLIKSRLIIIEPFMRKMASWTFSSPQSPNLLSFMSILTDARQPRIFSWFALLFYPYLPPSYLCRETPFFLSHFSL